MNTKNVRILLDEIKGSLRTLDISNYLGKKANVRDLKKIEKEAKDLESHVSSLLILLEEAIKKSRSLGKDITGMVGDIDTHALEMDIEKGKIDGGRRELDAILDYVLEGTADFIKLAEYMEDLDEVSVKALRFLEDVGMVSKSANFKKIRDILEGRFQ